METDPASLDPEERLNKFAALFSAGFGLLSLCAGLIPICGISLALLAIAAGIYGRRSENRATATVGIALGLLGLLIAAVYLILLGLRSNPGH